jgi:Tfp pilus tip-associated adhesin PilY1
MDAGSQLWVLWGTGNRMEPMKTGETDRFFAVKDKDFTTTLTKDDLEKVLATAGSSYQGTKSGWYMELPSNGEKVLYDSTVFAGMALFTTYTPTTGADPCETGGFGKFYALAMMPITIDGVTYNAGAGLMSKPANQASKDGGEKSMNVGKGMPTSPLVSQRPHKPNETPGMTDIFLTSSGGGGTDTVVNALGELTPPPDEEKKKCPPGTPPALCRLLQTPPQAQIIHWRDRRLQ